MLLPNGEGGRSKTKRLENLERKIGIGVGLIDGWWQGGNDEFWKIACGMRWKLKDVLCVCVCVCVCVCTQHSTACTAVYNSWCTLHPRELVMIFRKRCWNKHWMLSELYSWNEYFFFFCFCFFFFFFFFFLIFFFFFFPHRNLQFGTENSEVL